MRLNRKGFTVIESVITFMIIAIAGSMLILGIFNIVNIFTESSTIKSETNRLYNELVNRIDVEDGSETKMIFEFSDGSKYGEGVVNDPANPPINVTDYYTQVINPISIKLFAFDPTKKAEMLPGEVQQPEEPNLDDLDVEYRVATKLSDIVYQYSQIFPNTNKFSFYQRIGSETNAVKDNLSADNVFTKDVPNYFDSLLNPNKDIINGGLTVLEQTYKELVGNSKKIRWVYISYLGSSIKHTSAILFGYYVPERTIIHITDLNENVTIIPLPEAGGKIHPDQLPVQGNYSYAVLNNLKGDVINTYEFAKFNELEFINDSVTRDAGIIFVKVVK